jgi:hypothetical protein
LPDRKRLLPSNLPLHSLINSDCFGGGSEFKEDSCRPFEFYVNSPHISLGLFLSLSFSLSLFYRWPNGRLHGPSFLILFFFYFVILNFPLLLGIDYDYLKVLRTT